LLAQAEKGYHDWRRLSQEERSSQNKSIYPEEHNQLITKAIVLLECAAIHDLDEEKATLASTRKKLQKIKEDRRPTGRETQRSVMSRTSIESAKARKQFISRASAAVFGGLAVIVPMLIMSLHPTRLTQLLTASVSVVSIALVLAWFMDEAERKDIIAATAAYGAVLVVFVGASTTTT
jgi:VIT1/CCC1 family predicted Fe2+/Mn2+ transporter